MWFGDTIDEYNRLVEKTADALEEVSRQLNEGDEATEAAQTIAEDALERLEACQEKARASLQAFNTYISILKSSHKETMAVRDASHAEAVELLNDRIASQKLAIRVLAIICISLVATTIGFVGWKFQLINLP